VTGNQCVLIACIVEAEPIRYTPAGVTVLNLKIEHESVQTESGKPRTVKLAMNAVAFGTLADQLVNQPIGSHWKFSGYLTNSRQGKTVILNIQNFCKINF
jgi:primosomal replication protein N